MKKSDLKNGMIIEWKRGNKFLIIDQLAFGQNGTHSLNDYTEDLKDNLGDIFSDIVKVYTTNNENISLKNIFDENYLNLIWQRGKEIDWRKVPKWTKVVVNQLYYKNTYNRYFLKRTKDGFKACSHKPDVFTGSTERDIVEWDECRIHPSVEIKEEWYK